MNKVTRLHYLKAMGIDVWIAKNPVLGVSTVVEKPQESGVLIPQQSVSEVMTVVENIDNISQNSAENWQVLAQQVADCKQCSLCQTRTQTVLGSGNNNAEWMFIGEAPGEDEDREGLPFVGRAGQLLTEMIRALGLTRDTVYIANILKCRPPNNRKPEPEEVTSCNQFLQRQIELVKPKIILAVGLVAAQNLLQTEESLSQLRGQVHYLDKIPVIVIYHPAYLLRKLLEKRKAWLDLQNALNFFRNGKG